MDTKGILVVYQGDADENQIVELVKHLKKTMGVGHSFDVTVDKGGEYEKTFGFDGDGRAKIVDVLAIEAPKDNGKKPTGDNATPRLLNAYLGRTGVHAAMDKDATRDRGGCFDDTRKTYTGEALLAVLSMIDNFGAFHDCWDKFEPWRKQEFKDAQRAAADYVKSIEKKNLCNPCDFVYRKRS